MKHLHLENIFRSHFDQQATAVVLYMELKYLTTKNTVSMEWRHTGS